METTERIKRIVHAGKVINYFDYRGINDDDELISAVRASCQFVIDQKHETLQLSNVTGLYFTPGIVKPIMAEVDKCKHLIKRDAVVGIVGVKRILFQAYVSIFPGKTRPFEDEQSALEWLVSP
jgi:hypothetical protein